MYVLDENLIASHRGIDWIAPIKKIIKDITRTI
jgi:hypothetical protein